MKYLKNTKLAVLSLAVGGLVAATALVQAQQGAPDDALRELTTTRDGRFFGGVGARAAEGPQARVAANQEIKGPPSGATDLKRARRDGEAVVQDGIQLQQLLQRPIQPRHRAP